jgi:ChaC-like protein
MADLDQHRHTEADVVWGVAYHIMPSKVKEVKEYLDIREMYVATVPRGNSWLTLWQKWIQHPIHTLPPSRCFPCKHLLSRLYWYA